MLRGEPIDHLCKLCGQQVQYLNKHQETLGEQGQTAVLRTTQKKGFWVENMGAPSHATCTAVRVAFLLDPERAAAVPVRVLYRR